MKNIKRKIKILKERKIKKKIHNFFDWIKGAELVELKKCNISEDPVRPELSNEFRRSYGRKIFGVKYKNEICAIMCFGFVNEIPKNVRELDNKIPKYLFREKEGLLFLFKQLNEDKKTLLSSLILKTEGLIRKNPGLYKALFFRFVLNYKKIIS